MALYAGGRSEPPLPGGGHGVGGRRPAPGASSVAGRDRPADIAGPVPRPAEQPLAGIERRRCWRDLSRRDDESDPDPDVRRFFLELKRTAEMIRGMGHPLPAGLDLPAEARRRRDAPGERRGRTPRKQRPGRPKRLVRSVLASPCGARTSARSCTRRPGAELLRLATRGSSWSTGRPSTGRSMPPHFSTFTPILDFVHAQSYIFAAAFAGRAQAEGGAIYGRWVQAAWSGPVAAILPELEAHRPRWGSRRRAAARPTRDVVAEARRYLGNNAGRMRYDEYRRVGLPIMTSAVESVIKMINRRVKGSEKSGRRGAPRRSCSWRRLDLSETEVLPPFWSAREAEASAGRPYRPASLTFVNSNRVVRPDELLVSVARKRRVSRAVLDASALLALLFKEPGGRMLSAVCRDRCCRRLIFRKWSPNRSTRGCRRRKPASWWQDCRARSCPSTGSMRI